MFNKNTYLQLPQGNSNPHASTSVLGDEIFFHHGDVLSGHYLAGGDANPVVDAAAYFNHQGGLINGDPCAMVNSFPRGVAAAAAKKDRHSKIYTAQGPRDRRVRLSIGVARRFFDLQEILGFDKPSKTLDWLLNKSNTAIKDLEQSSKKSAVSSSPSDEVDSADNIGRFSGADSKRKLVEMNHKHKDSSKQAPDLVKESRVKARARARERTREKMCIKKLNENISNNGGYDDIPIQYMNNQQLDQFCHPTSYEDLIQQESILIKRKVKQYPGFQHQNLFISSSNYAVPSPADNWDISTNFASQSNICAILDQHKFFNSTSNN